MLHSRKILFIGKNSRLICQEMVGLGYACMALNTVAEAISWVNSHKKYDKPLPEIFMCDAYMQETDPLKLHDTLANLTLTKKPLFVLIAHQEDRILQYKAYKAGVDDYIVLPASAKDIHSRLQTIGRFKRAELNSAATPQVKQDISWPIWKRLFDVVAAASALVLLMPLFLLIALLIKLDSRGPVFYVSKRAGRNYHIFDFYKFRSMRINADKEIHTLARLNLYQGHTPFIKLKNDPRVTRMGALLRSTSLDELPQLLNVLKGDMSLIGNRPLPLYEAQHLTTDEWVLRFLAPAGMTGLWQVNKRRQDETDDQDRKHLDARYAVTQSLGQDYKIFVKTFSALRQYV
jgi:lipopolysaccharide/colanic/teichoic acid biosynthesis glycosyltransferase